MVAMQNERMLRHLEIALELNGAGNFLGRIPFLLLCSNRLLCNGFTCLAVREEGSVLGGEFISEVTATLK